MATVELTTMPSVPTLLARAALTARGRGGPLPDTRLTTSAVATDTSRLAAYERVCRYQVSDVLPPTYPHVLAFPLQLALMTDRSFPLALPGLVHVRNRIDVLRPIGAAEPLDLQVWAERFVTHDKGATVDLCAAATTAGHEVWLGRSTYLARGARAPQDAPSTTPTLVETGTVATDLLRTAAVWRIPADAGRRYAEVSGDVNPIHLATLAAKVFGFPHAIAHGMWVTACALAGLAGRLPDAITVDVEFHKPLYLPSAVDYLTAPRARTGTAGGWDFAVRNTRDVEIQHLTGAVRPI